MNCGSPKCSANSSSTTTSFEVATAPSHKRPVSAPSQWCGECDKCLFVNLVLAPFLSRSALRAIFASEPLSDPAREAQLRTLVGLGAEHKPFECVGDPDESAVALTEVSRHEEWRDVDALARTGARTAHRARGRGPPRTTRNQPCPGPLASLTSRASASGSSATASRAARRDDVSAGVTDAIVLVDDATDVDPDVIVDERTADVEALLECDVVLKSPGIPRRRADVLELEAHGVVVTSVTQSLAPRRRSLAGRRDHGHQGQVDHDGAGDLLLRVPR